MSLIIVPLTVSDMKDFGGELLKAHYQELTLHKDRVKLDVDWGKYYKLESMGVLVALGAWEEKELIGYSVFVLQPSMHYRTTQFASNDVLFLREDKRKGMAGIRLIKESEKALVTLGVQKVLWHVKFDTILGPLLIRLGYQEEEYTMGKMLGDSHGN